MSYDRLVVKNPLGGYVEIPTNNSSGYQTGDVIKISGMSGVEDFSARIIAIHRASGYYAPEKDMIEKKKKLKILGEIGTYFVPRIGS